MILIVTIFSEDMAEKIRRSKRVEALKRNQDMKKPAWNVGIILLVNLDFKLKVSFLH